MRILEGSWLLYHLFSENEKKSEIFPLLFLQKNTDKRLEVHKEIKRKLTVSMVIGIVASGTINFMIPKTKRFSRLFALVRGIGLGYCIGMHYTAGYIEDQYTELWGESYLKIKDKSRF